MAEVSKMTLWIAGIGLVWNLIGLAAFVNHMVMDTSELPELQRTFHDTMPLWAKAAFAAAVTMGVVGCAALLTGQSWAWVPLAISLLGIVLQNLHSFALSNGLEAFGLGAVAMPVVVFAIAAYLLFYSRSIA